MNTIFSKKHGDKKHRNTSDRRLERKLIQETSINIRSVCSFVSSWEKNKTMNYGELWYIIVYYCNTIMNTFYNKQSSFFQMVKSWRCLNVYINYNVCIFHNNNRWLLYLNIAICPNLVTNFSRKALCIDHIKCEGSRVYLIYTLLLNMLF